MHDMYVETQFSVFLINKPGVLAQTLTEFGKEKVNLIAMTMMDSVEHGVLRLTTSDRHHTREILKRLNIPVNETDVLCVTIDNKAGALADVATHLAQEHVNINYAYCTAGARGGRTTAVLKVADIKKAMKVLQGGGTVGAKSQNAKTKKSVRPKPNSRRR